MNMYSKREMRKNKKMNEDTKSLPSTSINWYPGHMAKTKRQIIEDLKLVDLVVEVLDARIPISSQNPDIQEYIKNKNKIEVLNKADLADDTQTANWVKYFEKNNIPAVITDSNSGKGIREVIKKIHTVSAETKEKSAQKGRAGRSIRVLVLGIPNVGKSSFINRISIFSSNFFSYSLILSANTFDKFSKYLFPW